MNESFSDKIHQNDTFSALLKRVTFKLVQSSLSGELSLVAGDIFNDAEWSFLISMGSLLAQSDKPRHQDAALRIAHAILLFQETSPLQKTAAQYILHVLANEPAILLSQRITDSGEFKLSDLPLPLRLEAAYRNFEYSILAHGRSFMLNKFQHNVFQKSKSSDFLTVSAPTSAGKSFVMKQVLLSFFEHNKANMIAVYLVPTRALISQVEQELKQAFVSNGEQVEVISIPKNIDVGVNRIVYVMTQERLEWLMNENSGLSVDLLIVDEAHRIEDLHRGILLHQVIEDLVLNNPAIKVIFSSPFVENPDELFKALPADVREGSVYDIIHGNYVSVNQNVILVEQIPHKPKEYTLTLHLQDLTQMMGILSLGVKPNHSNLPFIAYALGGDGYNIVYANEAGTAEKCAQIIAEHIQEKPLSAGLTEFIKLVKKVIHPNYVLVKTLEKGVAFHYGNMPQIIREGIVQLFEQGDLDFLVCTSTLLEGVNLPAKSIFITNPQKGRGNAMATYDFWNLAGRAGRWGQEFQGNVFCVSPDDWEVPTERKKHRITAAITRLSSEIDGVLSYLSKGMPREDAEKYMHYEIFFGYCLRYFLIHDQLPTLGISEDKRSLLEKYCVDIKSQSLVPKDILIKHSSISPYAQQDLLKHFLELDRDDLQVRMPPNVLESRQGIAMEYGIVVRGIQKRLSGKKYPNFSYLGVLIVQWLSGYPLARIISTQLEREKTRTIKENQSRKSPSAVIRGVMADIEQHVRFEFLKYSSCYIDLLRHALILKEENDLLSQLPDLTLMLEIGVSRKTQISLVELGLSRTTAIELSQLIPDENLDKNACKVWLATFDPEYQFDVPLQMIQEVVDLKHRLFGPTEV